ncbi:PP2C family protein-serine/threonine phosphatase [Novosphingobium sp. BL-52-GroH]|uniref:PP2C family protein-serine/threonine phosphatase n=1 Tax=Novosphingobium sp. BL-52-GroH TaxID=3349877 RepID=UPI00384B3BC3
MGAFSNSLVVPARTPLRVLVVDDDPLLLEVVAIQLEMLGCEVASADGGERGLSALESAEVDLLVTDWQMPGVDGMEVVRRARAARAGEGYLHIVMMTARGDEQTMRAALEAGVDDFLEKPVQPIALEIAVASALRNRLLHRRLERRNNLLSTAHGRTREALDRIRADLAAATALHERLLPPEGRIGALALSRMYRPAAVLGGDSIGASLLPDGSVLFFVIDVRGHGVPAALDSFHLHHRLKQMRPATPVALGNALATVNEEIAAREDDSYATIACGLLSPEREEGWICCAGHPSPILLIDGEVNMLEDGRSMPAGWFSGTEFAPARFAFPRGARLMLYSDGVTESTDEAGEEFGLDRLSALMARTRPMPLAQAVQDIERGLTSRRLGAGFEDDISLLAFEHEKGDDGDG